MAGWQPGLTPPTERRFVALCGDGAVLLRRLDRLQQHIKQQQRRPPAAATRRVAASQPLAPITSFTDAIAELRAHYEEYRYIEAGALLDRLRMSLKAAGASAAVERGLSRRWSPAMHRSKLASSKTFRKLFLAIA